MFGDKISFTGLIVNLIFASILNVYYIRNVGVIIGFSFIGKYKLH